MHGIQTAPEGLQESVVQFEQVFIQLYFYLNANNCLNDKRGKHQDTGQLHPDRNQCE